MKQESIVTITDGISPTSMPFNEFVCYRIKKRPEEKQVIIQLFEHGVDKNVKMPDCVEYYSIGMNIVRLHKIIVQIEKKYFIKAYHIHEGKSVILFSLATLLLKRRKTVYTIHSTFRNYPFHNKLFCFIGSLLAMNVICVSETSFKYLPKILKLFRGRNIKPIQNGVDIDRIGLVPNNKKNQEVFVITYVARLVPLKRHSFLLEVIKNTKNTVLNLIGIGPLENELKNLAHVLQIENRVNFLGLLPREIVYYNLFSTDLYVSTSSYEGLPIGVLEAMGCKVVCLVSNIEQHEEIKNKCPSLMTLPNQIELWEKKIFELQQLKEKDRDKIRDANRTCVEKYFSLESMHNNYDLVYNSL